MIQQQQIVKVGGILRSNDFGSILDPSKLICRIIDVLNHDKVMVDAIVSQMETFCARQGIEVKTKEAGTKEMLSSVEWLRQHFTERVSGQFSLKLFQLQF